jgi:hypothetical protein
MTSAGRARGGAAKLELRTGPQPATWSAPASGALLCEAARCPDNPRPSLSRANIKLETWSGKVIKDGAVGHFRIISDTGACLMQEPVTEVGCGGYINMDNVNIQAGQMIILNTSMGFRQPHRAWYLLLADAWRRILRLR